MMTRRESILWWVNAVVCAGIMIAIVFVGTRYQVVPKSGTNKQPPKPPPQVTITKPEAVLLADPLWMDEQSRFTKHGGTVYLLDVKGHRLAVVISDRGAGICELTREPEAEAKP